ncbi:ParB/RepB/Spo0J family partition protein [Oceaniglobus trochenteri]|uniref:ParB/RepB/Spo0J family partition protein n=1 Tax=Oceaniglobus trochenteri TaxID=2763260 RepID=UPI001CFFA015|nr:ParB N-terminal domain-containing protein [Oceaniglobus trochenteri]
MAGKNRFGFGPLETDGAKPRRERSVGPMGAAVRDAAESLQETTEAKVAQRRQNAEEAKAFREASAEGRVLIALPLSEVHTDALPRDRLELEAVASSDEMEELKASIRARGQKEPIEVYVAADGRRQLKKGWRRLTALTQLYEETGDARFASVTARIDQSEEDQLARYVDMVEENVVREDLSFAEMAQVAITAAGDPAVEGQGADALVGRLYGSLHKMKRSYIRSFVYLLETLGPALQWPKDVARNLGVDVARALKAGHGNADRLRADLAAASRREDQARILAAFIAKEASRPAKAATAREKFEFHVGEVKVTARKGECRILSRIDFTSVPRDKLDKAIRAFEAVLREEG